MSDSFTEGERRLMMVMVQCIQGTINVDWDRVVSKAGYANANSAKRQWYKLRDKIVAMDTTDKEPEDPRYERMAAATDKPCAEKKTAGKRTFEESGMDTNTSATKKQPKQRASFGMSHRQPDTERLCEVKSESIKHEDYA